MTKFQPRQLILSQLRQGASAHGLALTCGFALALSLFPLLGTTTLLCLLFGTIFRLNQPVLQALNYLLFPLQIIFIPIFLRIGESILNVPHLTIHVEQFARQMAAEWQLFLQQYGMAALHAILAWLLLAPVASGVLYFVLRPALENLKRRMV